MKKLKFIKSVLYGTLIVVCICGCGKGTSEYLVAEEVTITEMETQMEDNLAEENQGTEQAETLLYVYVCGEVNTPGVYTLPEGSRVCDVFVLAGGFTENAAVDYWNQARVLKDGEMIYVPTIEEAKERDQDISSQDVSFKDNSAKNKININTASKAQLMTIPGIGEAKANAIIAYRESNGAFSSVEEIKKVEGIKDGVYTKMKDYIVIN